MMREYRKRSGLTMKKLGEMVGASEASISQYETGRVEPDLKLVARIADILGVSVDALLGRKEDEETEIPRTAEAKILANGIDKLPKEQREQALNVVKAMFLQYADLFEERKEDDDTGL